MVLCRMKAMKRNFDKEAAAWDDKPQRIKLVQNIADAITGEIHLTASMNVLDFGCGTGLLTMQLQPFVRFITAVDSSSGMLDVLNDKIKKQNVTNVKIRLLDIEKGGVLEGRYDLITSSMTFHHIKNIRFVLNRFYDILAPAGKLCIADLDADQGQFHENNDGVFHFGFDREILSSMLKEAGFRDVRYRTAASVIKPVQGSQERAFTVFLATAGKFRDQ